MKERHTIQKDIIYAALCRMGNHPTADMVYEQVRAQQPSVSRATVYRVLGRMADQGFIQRLPVPDGADHYDHQTYRHYHILCDSCGRMDDVTMPDPGDLRAAISDSCGYRLTGETVLFHGLCRQCQQ